MNFFFVILEGLREIWAHKFRSFLTMLGVILGVSALMATFALTAGMAAGFKENLSVFGGLEKISIEAQDPPEEQQDIAEISPGLTYNDVKALRRYARYLKYVSPEVKIRGTLIHQAGNFTWEGVTGVEPIFLETDQHKVAKGRFISDLDLRNRHRVTVIGHSIAEDLFEENESPLGKPIFINEQIFTVVGVFERYETESERRRRIRREKEKENEEKTNARVRTWGNWSMTARKNDEVVIPLTTYQVCFRMANVDENGVDAGPDMTLDDVNFEVHNLDVFKPAIEEARKILLKTHRGIEDFRFETREGWFDNQKAATRSAKISGGFIAGISLLVGGLGITNIMLASISERIRDIGIRRAVGARRRDIFIQILTESVLLAVMGGLLGLLCSKGLIEFLIVISPQDNAPIIEPEGAIIALTFAICTGIAAGIYPAFKAANLSPLQALRYE